MSRRRGASLTIRVPMRTHAPAALLPLALALAAPLVAAPELPAEWLRPAADVRGPLEKADPRLLASGPGATEEVDVLVALRLPEEAR